MISISEATPSPLPAPKTSEDEKDRVQVLAEATIIAPKSPVVAPPVAPQRTVWTLIKDIFSSIVAFFKRIFGIEDSAVNPALLAQLSNLAKSKSTDPRAWDAMIDAVDEEKSKIIQENLAKLAQNSPSFEHAKEQQKKTEVDPFDNFKVKIRFELLKVIYNIPKSDQSRNVLKNCLNRLGEVPGITSPAALSNHSSNCYMDSLLQVLFASKSFIKILKSIDINDENQNAIDKDYVPVVTALKNYCFGQVAGLSPKEINDLRDDISNTISALPVGKGLDNHAGVDGQQDATEWLLVIFNALNIENHINLELEESKKFKLDNYSINTRIKQGANLPPLRVPDGRELLAEEKQDAEQVQERIDEVFGMLRALEGKYGLQLEIKKPDVPQVLKHRINKKNAPFISLQDVIDEHFKVKQETPGPFQDALEKYGIDLKALKEDPSVYNEILGEERLKELLKDASVCDEASKLVGDAPGFLTFSLNREVGPRLPLNTRKIEIPADGYVYVSIWNNEVENRVKYKVVGVAGGNISPKGGHWVANVNINNQWFHVNDAPTSIVSMKDNSPNADNLTKNSRLYVLERVIELIPRAFR